MECKVCEEKFGSKEDLIAHMKFAYHGMLWKTSQNKQVRNNEMETIKEGRDWGGQGRLRTRSRTAMVETVRNAADWLEDLEAGSTQILKTRG